MPVRLSRAEARALNLAGALHAERVRPTVLTVGAPIQFVHLADGGLRILHYHPFNIANVRLHWAARATAVKRCKEVGTAAALEAGWPKRLERAHLDIVFVFPKNVRVDTDNLMARAKPLVDGIAAVCLVDDNANALEYPAPSYRVEKGVTATEVWLRAA